MSDNSYRFIYWDDIEDDSPVSKPNNQNFSDALEDE